MPPGPFARIMVMGPPGSGKSTLARQLGAALSLPVHHLDALYHGPGWAPRPAAAFRADLDAIAATPRWVIDGNYSGAIAGRLAGADLIVLLDLPRRVRMPRLIRRIARDLGRVRVDSAPECPERIDLAFLRYAWTWQSAVRPRILAALAGQDHRMIRLTDRAAVAALVARLTPPVRASAA